VLYILLRFLVSDYPFGIFNIYSFTSTYNLSVSGGISAGMLVNLTSVQSVTLSSGCSVQTQFNGQPLHTFRIRLITIIVKGTHDNIMDPLDEETLKIPKG